LFFLNDADEDGQTYCSKKVCVCQGGDVDEECYVNGAHKCVSGSCKEGYHEHNGENYECRKNECVCDHGHPNSNSVCKVHGGSNCDPKGCEAEYVFNAENEKCESCPIDTFYDRFTGSCKKPSGFQCSGMDIEVPKNLHVVIGLDRSTAKEESFNSLKDCAKNVVDALPDQDLFISFLTMARPDVQYPKNFKNNANITKTQLESQIDGITYSDFSRYGHNYIRTIFYAYDVAKDLFNNAINQYPSKLGQSTTTEGEHIPSPTRLFILFTDGSFANTEERYINKYKNQFVEDTSANVISVGPRDPKLTDKFSTSDDLYVAYEADQEVCPTEVVDAVKESICSGIQAHFNEFNQARSDANDPSDD